MPDLIFVSAQPDEMYFHWQVELYLYQFSKHGIKDKCYAIFGYRGDKQSEYIVNLAKKYPNIRWYKDTRNTSVKNHYIPSVRPHVLKQFFKENPTLSKRVFYHDSDIFLVKMPDFDSLSPNMGYVSDTISYIGYEYIRDKAKLYKSKYPKLEDDDIFKRMCACVGISEDLVKENNKNSGGAQYLLSDVDETFWENVETCCVKLYDMLKIYEGVYSLKNNDDHIQSWTADMWAVLWEYWKTGKKTEVHAELDFSWAVDPIEKYHSKNIFHLAGVTEESSKNTFYKGRYTDKNVFKEYIKNKHIFDHVSKKSATYPYVSIIKEYAESLDIEVEEEKGDITGFILECGHDWSGTYTKTEDIYFGKPLWRSDNYIIFFNSKCWILTGAQYEDEISKVCGGFGSSDGNEPYDDCWKF